MLKLMYYARKRNFKLYNLNFDIKSNPHKTNIIEVNTILKVSPNEDVKHKIFAEINCTALVSIENTHSQTEKN